VLRFFARDGSDFLMPDLCVVGAMMWRGVRLGRYGQWLLYGDIGTVARYLLVSFGDL
jgi:hypothetical protein